MKTFLSTQFFLNRIMTGLNVIDKLKELHNANELSNLISDTCFCAAFSKEDPVDQLNYLESLGHLIDNLNVEKTIQKFLIITIKLLEVKESFLRQRYLKFLLKFIESHRLKLGILKQLVFQKILQTAEADIFDEFKIINALTDNGQNIDLVENDVSLVI